jgi:hypothetical protein
MLITQRPHSSSFEDQARVVRDILANPAARERSQEVAVGDDQHVEGLVHATLGLANGVLVEALADVGDDGVAAGGDVGGGSVGQPLVFDGFLLLLPFFLAFGSLGFRWGKRRNIERTKHQNLLSPRTPIPPNIPYFLPTLLPLLRNLFARDPLVIAVLPLPHALTDLDPGCAVVFLCSFDLLAILPILVHPRQRQPQIQQFQRPLRPLARRDVDVREVARHDKAVGAY